MVSSKNLLSRGLFNKDLLFRVYFQGLVRFRECIWNRVYLYDYLEPKWPFCVLIIKDHLFEDVWFKPAKTKDKYRRYQVYVSVYIIVYLDLQTCGEFQADDLRLLEELHGGPLCQAWLSISWHVPSMVPYACGGVLCEPPRLSELVLTAPTASKKTNGQNFLPPPKTNMTMWKITIFNRKYIFKWLILHCHVSFLGCKFSESLISQPAYIH